MNKISRSTLIRSRPLLIVLATSWVFYVLIETYRFVDSMRSSREADHWRHQAMSAASGETTYDQARHWLEIQGFNIVIWNPYVHDGYIGEDISQDSGDPMPRLKHRIVLGQRNLRPGNWLIRPTWLYLTFQFTPDGQFENVISANRTLAMPTTQFGP